MRGKYTQLMLEAMNINREVLQAINGNLTKITRVVYAVDCNIDKCDAQVTTIMDFMIEMNTKGKTMGDIKSKTCMNEVIERLKGLTDVNGSRKPQRSEYYQSQCIEYDGFYG